MTGSDSELTFGKTGSGKAPSSGKELLRAILHGNMGGIILTAKPEHDAEVREVAPNREMTTLMQEENNEVG